MRVDFPLEDFERSLPADATPKYKDAGSHYRFEYQGIKLDPFRIAQIYEMTDFCMMTILKKCLCAGNRGHKDLKQDLEDIICAAKRKLDMIREDETNNY